MSTAPNGVALEDDFRTLELAKRHNPAAKVAAPSGPAAEFLLSEHRQLARMLAAFQTLPRGSRSSRLKVHFKNQLRS